MKKTPTKKPKPMHPKIAAAHNLRGASQRIVEELKDLWPNPGHVPFDLMGAISDFLEAREAFDREESL